MIVNVNSLDEVRTVRAALAAEALIAECTLSQALNRLELLEGQEHRLHRVIADAEQRVLALRSQELRPW